jgi:hypothetical protein
MNDIANPPAQYCLSGPTEADPHTVDSAEARTAATPLQDYVPEPSDLLKIVCVNFHVFQDQWGQGNFQPSEESRLRQIIDWINDRFIRPSWPSTRIARILASGGPSSMFSDLLRDTRIRFRIHRIEFIRMQRCTLC